VGNTSSHLQKRQFNMHHRMLGAEPHHTGAYNSLGYRWNEGEFVEKDLVQVLAYTGRRSSEALLRSATPVGQGASS
jgi:hypothetical protein